VDSCFGNPKSEIPNPKCSLSASALAKRSQGHGQPPGFESVVLVDLGDLSEACLYLLEDISPLVDMGKFPPAEPQAELYAVAPREKILSPLDLDPQVVVADLGSLDTNFLQLGFVSPGLGFLVFLLLFVFELPKVHNPADRRPGCGGNLHKVQPGLPRTGLGIASIHNASLLLVLVDQADRRNTNLMIATQISSDGLTP